MYQAQEMPLQNHCHIHITAEYQGRRWAQAPSAKGLTVCVRWENSNNPTKKTMIHSLAGLI
jgi:hypothetical protein